MKIILDTKVEINYSYHKYRTGRLSLLYEWLNAFAYQTAGSIGEDNMDTWPVSHQCEFSYAVGDWNGHRSASRKRHTVKA